MLGEAAGVWMGELIEVCVFNVNMIFFPTWDEVDSIFTGMRERDIV